MVVWREQTWRDELDKAMAEIKRVLRPGGTIVILKTLGTGYETPHPSDELKAYFTYLEEAGFAFTWIRTDHQFQSLSEAKP